MSWAIRVANPADLDGIKRLCDAHRNELGFVMRPSLVSAIERREVLIAHDADQHLAGFVHFHHRRDQQTTLYHIVVDPKYRLLGVGNELVQRLRESALGAGKVFVQLKCPVTLPSNKFYEKLGFRLVETEAGKGRPLNVWRLELAPSGV